MDRTKLLVFFHAEASEIAERDLGHATEDTLIADLGLDSLSVLELVGSVWAAKSARQHRALAQAPRRDPAIAPTSQEVHSDLRRPRAQPRKRGKRSPGGAGRT